MTTQKFIYMTIQEVQSKEAELKAIYGNDKVMKCLNKDTYYYVTFNIFN